MFPDLSTYRVLGFIGPKNVFGCVYRDDVAERLANGEFIVTLFRPEGAGGGGFNPLPKTKKTE